MEKVRAELAIFFVKKESARVTSDVIFIVCTLIDNSYDSSQSARGNLDSYSKIIGRFDSVHPFNLEQ